MAPDSINQSFKALVAGLEARIACLAPLWMDGRCIVEAEVGVLIGPWKLMSKR